MYGMFFKYLYSNTDFGFKNVLYIYSSVFSSLIHLVELSSIF